MLVPDPIKRISDSLSELPSIGPRQATRLAFYLATEGHTLSQELEKNLALLAKIKLCERCFFVHGNEGTLCGICKDPGRDKKTILIIEKETDLISLENTRKYKGVYFLVGPISKTGILDDWQKERMGNLKNYVKKELAGKAKEIILGFNPGSVGDFHISILKKELGELAEKMSTLGRGLPTGGEIEFADDETLGSALERRS